MTFSLNAFSGAGPWDLAYFASLLLTGCLFGFTICSFSCIPIVCTLVVGTRRGFKSGFASAMTFAAGRVAGYTIVGMLCGLTGMAGLFDEKQILAAAGILFLLVGLSLIFYSGKNQCKKSRCFSDENQHAGLGFSSLGLITGILPCAPYTAVMGAAAASGSLITGGLSAFCFGLGTCISPLLLMGGGAGWISKKIIEKTPDIDLVLRKIAGIIIILMGIRML